MKRLKWFTASLVLAMASGTAMAQEKDKTKNEDRPRPSRRGRMRGEDTAPKVGQAAPSIKLKSLDGKQKFNLAEFKGAKPVVLFFGSYT